MSRNNTIIGGYVNPLAFSPVLWVDFADASTVTVVSGNISQVVGKGSGGYVCSQATPGFRPAYVSAGLNGLNLARFDGTNDELFVTPSPSNLFRNISGATVYIVRAFGAPPAGAQVVFNVLTGTSVVRSRLSTAATGLSSVSGRTLDADSFSSIGGTTATGAGVYAVQTGLFDYANTDLFLYLNGALENSNTSFNAATTTSNTASVNTSIGSSFGVNFFNGDICEILVFHSAHNAATRTAITQYLRAKWGI